MNSDATVHDNPLATIKADLASGIRAFIVKGAAGTGKTMLIGQLIPFLEEMRYDVKLLAPTGRAAKMIKIRTQHPAATIHSAIFRISDKPQDGTSEGGDLKWVFPLKTERPARTAFIIDEASMVGSARHVDGILQFGSGSLLQDLVAYSGIGYPDSDNLVFFVGDPYQLPPVNEKVGIPPALDEKNLAGLIGFRIATVELTTVHRQTRDSGILAEANKIRMAIAYRLYGSFCYGRHPDIHEVDEDAVERLYHPEHGLNDKIILAFTNERVWELNGKVRKMLGRKGALPENGERLLSLRNTMVAVGGDGERREASFMNGDMLHVLSVDANSRERLEGFYRPKGGTETLRYEFTFCRMRVGWLYDYSQEDVEAWVNVTPILSEEYRKNPEYAAMALYVAVVQRIRARYQLGYGKADEERLHELLKRSAFYHAPLVTFGYAITGHKAQGGEWNEVWIDYRYSQNRMTEAYFRWIYTTTTRARNVLFAIAPPRFDDISEAVERGLQRFGETPSSQKSTDSALTLAALLARHGYVMTEAVRRQYALHVKLARRDDPLAETGTLDLNYNGKGMVSYVHLAFLGAGDAFGADVAALKGRRFDSVFPDEARTRENPSPQIEIVEPHERIRERLMGAAEKASLQVMSIRSLTVNQLRLEISSKLGDGYVDFYIDGKGRVTEMGSMTVNSASLLALKEGLAA